MQDQLPNELPGDQSDCRPEIDNAVGLYVDEQYFLGKLKVIEVRSASIKKEL